MSRDVRRFALVAAPLLLAGSALTGLTGSAAAAVTTPLTVRALEVTPPVDIRSSACPANIVEGDSGTCVVALQDLLSNWGYFADLGPSGADGGFGPDTLAAVEAFQTSARIGVDGQVGPQTKAALYSMVQPLRGQSTQINERDGLCLNGDLGTAGRNGQVVDGWQCLLGWGNQQWRAYWVPNSPAVMYVNAYDGECLDADSNGFGRNGQIVQGWACNGRVNQEWVPDFGHSLVNVADGLCLDADTNTAGRNGQKIQDWACNGSTEQAWSGA